MDAEATESVARRILLGLGFSQEQLDGPYEALSGGWKSRCSLAAVLVQDPDIVSAFPAVQSLIDDFCSLATS